MSEGIKFTPGPWVAVPNDGAYVKRPDLGTIRIEERATRDEMVLAVVVTDCPRLHEQAEANARLIAAAPEMLDALHEAEAELELAGPDIGIEDGQFVPTPTLALRIVRNAIARATGDQP